MLRWNQWLQVVSLFWGHNIEKIFFYRVKTEFWPSFRSNSKLKNKVGSMSFQMKNTDLLVVTSLGSFKPLCLEDGARLLTTVVGLSELLRFKRLYVHGGLFVGGRGSDCRGDHLEVEIKAAPRRQWEGETGRVWKRGSSVDCQEICLWWFRTKHPLSQWSALNFQ